MRFSDRQSRDRARRVRSILTHPRATESLNSFGQVPLFSELYDPDASEGIRDAHPDTVMSMPDVEPIDLTRGRTQTSQDIIATAVSISGGSPPEGGEGGAPTNVPYVVTSSNATLTNEKILTAGGGLSRTVASGSVTLDVNVDDSTIEVNVDTLRVKDAGITYAKIQDVTANRILGSIGGGTVAEITCTAAGRALLDDADASAQRTTLGLGTIATEDTPLGISKGGTGQTDRQDAIDALTDVTSATNEHVLTKDTSTGNAIFKAVPGGGTPASSVTDETTFGISPAVGASTDYARSDHTHGSPTNPITAHAADANAHHNRSHALSSGDDHTGTLTHEQGGLEADVSAYDGIVRISGGSTSAVALPLTHENGGLEADVSSYDGFVYISGGATSAVDDTGSGNVVRATSPTITTPVITQINPGDSDFTVNVNSASDRVVHLKNAGAGEIGIKFWGNAYYDTIINNTSSGGTATIDWDKVNKQKLTLSEDVTLTFDAPGGPCNLILEVIQDSTARTITWPASTKWPSGDPPTLSSGSGDIDIITFYYNGTTYYGGYLYDFTI